MLGMLGGEDVIEGGELVEIGVAGVRVAAVERFREPQHVEGVAGLGTVDVVDEVRAGLLAGEMLAPAVAAEGQRALARHDVPEELRGVVVGLVPAEFRDPREADGLRDLRVGVQVVQVVHPLRHRVQQHPVGEPAGDGEVLGVAGDRVAIGQDLVHAAVLVAHHLLHLGVGEAGREVDGPVAEAQEQFFRLLVAAVQPRVAQARVHLVQVVERGPGAGIHAEIALLELAPDVFAVGHAAHVALAPVGVVLDVGVGAFLQLGEHVLHPAAALFVARRGVHRHRGQVVAAHVAVQAVPVGIGLLPGLQPRLDPVGSQKPVAVILQQGLDVEVPGLLEGAVQQFYITQRELVGIETVLSKAGHGPRRRQQKER